ncbi:MAG: hypothetical protein IJ856_03380 [Candidatus Methanomethylophilaceae archaeon]|nr:hypothetical protein [Candidatus Methanomethylophilaceae archaeon]
MRMVLYGLPCAGKDALVSQMDFVDRIKESDWLDAQSGGGFINLSPQERQELRRRFIDIIETSPHDVAVNDCFSIPSENGFSQLFTKDDSRCYDVFVYIDLPAEVVLNGIAGYGKESPIPLMSVEDVLAWRDSEVSELQSTCMALGKEFIIFDPKFDPSLEFFKGLFEGRILTAPQVSRLAADRILGATDEPVILISDGDKTLADYDLTRSLEVPVLVDLIDVFRGDRYTTFQFWAVYRHYTDLPGLDQKKREAAEAVMFNLPLLNDLAQIHAYKVVVTAGSEDLWTYAAVKSGVFDMVIGADNDARRNMSRFGKALIVRYLREAGRHVIALGDEIVDFDMLEEADRGYMIAHLKRNASLQAAVSNGTKLKQPSSNEVKFDGVQVVDSIHGDVEGAFD